MSSATTVSFKWLDILEKEFDRAFVNLDLLLGELDVEDTEEIYVAKKQLAVLCSCFAQLSHKALTMFQIHAKTEAELINLRSEFVHLKTENQICENRLRSVLLQWHTMQLEQLPYDSNQEEIAVDIKKRLQKDLEQYSPVHDSQKDDADKLIISLENWRKLLEVENESLRRTIAGLQAEVCAARLAARYLDKELVGRIQQLQLISKNNMSMEVKTKLWDQLDEEILLQRHKTVIRVMQQQKNSAIPPSDIIGTVRTVHLHREPDKGLGVSVTGGKEHDIPIIVSDLEPNRHNTDLYVGDAILNVNGISLTNLTHKEAVKILSEQIGDLTLTVKTVSRSNDCEDLDNFSDFRYTFFEDFEDNRKGIFNYKETTISTPTAPRTPLSNSLENLNTDVGCASKTDCNHESSEGSGVVPTVLQKIFNIVSPTDKRKQQQCDGLQTKTRRESSNGRNENKSPDSVTLSGRKVIKSQILPTTHNSPKIVKAETVAEIGDSSLGTPV